jgi:glycine betaine catabolism B
MQIKASKFELNFLKKEKKSIDAFSFFFDRKELDFDFIPGQYLKLFLDIENPDERGSSRYFTISSSPTDKDYLTITTRVIQSSFKIKLNSLNPGDKVRIFGPIGYFDFDPNLDTKNIFIAGGIGITPYHSILRFIESKKIKSKITLFVSFPRREEAIFFDELKELCKTNPNLKIVYSLTKEDNIYPEFESGRIDLDMIKKYVQDYSKSKFFITGPEEMVLSMFESLKSSGIAEKNIFKEDFPGY